MCVPGCCAAIFWYEGDLSRPRRMAPWPKGKSRRDRTLGSKRYALAKRAKRAAARAAGDSRPNRALETRRQQERRRAKRAAATEAALAVHGPHGVEAEAAAARKAQTASVSAAARAGALAAFLSASAAREAARAAAAEEGPALAPARGKWAASQATEATGGNSAEEDAKHLAALKRAKLYRRRHRLLPKPVDGLRWSDSDSC